jgi:carbon storage regulator
MLVLTRKADQEIVISGNIRVRVLSVRGNRVRLGIDAPRDVSVARQELEADLLPLSEFHEPMIASGREELLASVP